MLGIISYGMGNLASVQNSLAYLQIPSVLVDDPGTLDQCDRLILPGVGAFGAAMEKMAASGFDRAIKQQVARKIPLLGICLGMQLLFEESDELGKNRGLGLIRGRVERIDAAELRVPHVGWNSVAASPASRLLAGCAPNSDFYFVHSYHCRAADPATVTGKCAYGSDLAAVVESGNLFGCQFHPEKSQRAGLAVLKNFAALSC